MHGVSERSYTSISICALPLALFGTCVVGLQQFGG